MDLRVITEDQKDAYNQAVTHVVQSWEWGEFRKKMGPILRHGLYVNNKLKSAFTITLHKIPFSSQYVGFLPKGPIPDKDLADALEKIGKENNCTFIKVETDVTVEQAGHYKIDPRFTPSPKKMYYKHNILLDLTLSEEELLAKMNQKTRYNIRLAQKKGVWVEERTDDTGLELFLKLHFETTARQGFYSHNGWYHRTVWELLKIQDMARVLIGFYKIPGTKKPKALSAWMLYSFKNTLYYPYGASSSEYREVMANNLVAWEAIKVGKQLGLKEFDMWGVLPPDYNPKDPRSGFTRFKEGYGGKRVEYLGTFDMVFNDELYWMFTFVDKITPLKVILLKLLRK